jgi:CSLREA domain-containing protein
MSACLKNNSYLSIHIRPDRLPNFLSYTGCTGILRMKNFALSLAVLVLLLFTGRSEAQVAWTGPDSEYNPQLCAQVEGSLNIYWEGMDGSATWCEGIEYTNGTLADALDGTITMQGIAVSNDQCIWVDSYNFTVSPDKRTMAGIADSGGLNVAMTLTRSPDEKCFVGHWIDEGSSADFRAHISASVFPGLDNETFIVTTVADTDDGVCDGNCSLREALNAANSNGVGLDYIDFDSSVFSFPQTIRLGSALPDIASSLSIVGPGSGLVDVRGRRGLGGDFRIFEIPGDGLNISMSGLTVSNGSPASGGGGGIRSNSELRLTGVAVINNRAIDGAGVQLNERDGFFTDSTFSGNVSSSGGGGIAYLGAAGSTLRLVSTTISGNTAAVGGGIATNTARIVGAGTHEVFLINSTVANNVGFGGIHADASGGLPSGPSPGTGGQSINGTLFGTRVYLSNSIIANNENRNLSRFANPGNTAFFHSLGHNLTSDDGSGFLNSTGDQINTDPLLGPLADNGGSTPTHALLQGSPALDKGANNSGPAIDQRGFPRPFDIVGIAPADGGDNSDIGAVEMQAIMVTNADDSGDGSLRQALLDANANGAGHDDILFDSTFFSTRRTINLAGALPLISSSLNMIGPGANMLTVRRDTGGDYRIIDISTAGLAIGISGVTISNGRTNNAGGGIFSKSDLNLRQMVVSDNQAVGGGGIRLDASGYIDSSTLSGNTAGQAGGILFLGVAGSVLQLVNSTVSHNNASLYSGVFVSGAFAGGGKIELRVTNSTIANNTGGSPGLNVDVSRENTVASALLVNSIVANNEFANFGTFAVAGSEANMISLGHNLTSDNGGGFLDATGDQINTDPLLRPVAPNGGPTPTHSLPKNSPAIDSGSCRLSGLTADQRGVPRPFDLAGASNTDDGCDIGAFEWSDLNGNGAEDGDEIHVDGFEEPLPPG